MRDPFWNSVGIRIKMRRRLLDLLESDDDIAIRRVDRIIMGLEANIRRSKEN